MGLFDGVTDWILGNGSYDQDDNDRYEDNSYYSQRDSYYERPQERTYENSYKSHWDTIHLYGYYIDYSGCSRWVSEEPFDVLASYNHNDPEYIRRITMVRYPDAVDTSRIQIFYHGSYWK